MKLADVYSKYSQILPPLLILPLVVMPWDATTIIYWMGCGIAAFISLFTLLKNLIRRGLDSADGLIPTRSKRLRPMLTVAIFFVAVATGFIVEAVADHYTEELAMGLQRSCKERSICPSAPDGWQMEEGVARSNFGHWSFVYVTNSQQSEFELWIHRRNENEKCIHGGNTIALSAMLSMQCKSDASHRFDETQA